MEKQIIRNERLGEQYYCINHPSGLTVLVWEMENYSTTHALFGTKYGSINTKFKTDEDKDYVSVPEGIAHYLEHKLFENEDCDVFSLYAKTGASANAYTSFDKTCYLFSCTDNYEESLKILLDFVQKPYFTKETVEKEQGIIGQEIRMYEDDPNWRVFFNMLTGVYHNHPVRIDIAGTVESIAKIDADLLYRCYNTFYNLNNMILSVAGNVKVEKVIEICDEMLKPCKNHNLETVFEKEPETVFKREVIQNLEVSLPLFNIGFKAKPEKGREALKSEIETNIILSLLADESSPLYKKMFDKGLINSNFGTEVFSGDGFFCSIFGGESKNPNEVLSEIIDEIERVKVEGFDQERFEIIKKSYYGSQIRGFNNVESVATLMINSYMSDVIPFDTVEIVAGITLDDIYKRLFSNFCTDNYTISVINPVKQQEAQ